MPLTLVSLRVSPWSERVKWALDHHGLAYTRVEHLPVVGERRLRRLVGPSKPLATVPVLLTGNEVIDESYDIARYADRHGRGAKLIPDDREPAVREWVQRADATTQAGRGPLIAAMIASPGALDESLPRAVPGWLRPFLRPVGRHALRAFAKKYRLNLHDDPGAKIAVVRQALDAARSALAKQHQGHRYLLGEFTYADIAMATVLQSIAPLGDAYLKVGPAMRAVWTREDLKTDYPDLVEWRDALYAKHRRSPGIR